MFHGIRGAVTDNFYRRYSSAAALLVGVGLCVATPAYAQNVVIGNGATADTSPGNGNIAIGQGAAAGGQGGAVGMVAIGQDAKTRWGYSWQTAIGAGAVTDHNATVAVGDHSSATAAESTALGSGAQATATGAVALGTNSVANQANTVSVGSVGNERRIVNVAAGVDRTDAVNVGQLRDVESALNERMTILQGTVLDTRKEARQGVAAAIAMTTAPMPSAPGRMSWAMNLATFKGEYAFGGSLAYRFDAPIPIALTAGYAYGGGKSHAARVGLQGEF